MVLRSLFGPFFLSYAFLESGLFAFGFNIGYKKSPYMLKEVVLALKLTRMLCSLFD